MGLRGIFSGYHPATLPRARSDTAWYGEPYNPNELGEDVIVAGLGKLARRHMRGLAIHV